MKAYRVTVRAEGGTQVIYVDAEDSDGAHEHAMKELFGDIAARPLYTFTLVEHVTEIGGVRCPSLKR